MALKMYQIIFEMEMSATFSSGCTRLQMYMQHVVDHVAYCRLMLLNLAETPYAKA